MLLGTLPSRALLQRYKLVEYADMADALRGGDVALLRAALDRHQVLFRHIVMLM
jgi:hypothetical protein